MADTESNIKVSIDTTNALASLKNLQRQISAFHTSMAKSGAAANAVTSQMQQGLINSINATGKFAAQMKTIKTTTESFTSSLEKNKFSLGEYFRYAGGASKSFGKLFKTEFETINKVARENVKDLQTQYIKMGRDANGAMKAIAVRPLALDMNDLATKQMLAAEKQALLNQLLKQGSTNLLNFGKNTQWAGRQLMVGFTIPLITVGSQAAKTFMDMETQAIRFKKVYGDLFTPQAETNQALDSIKALGREFTKYGIAVSDTVGLAADAAAAGFQGIDLQNQTTAATRLSVLGQIDNQKALETTISLQNAFGISSSELANNIDFLNAVENQTVTSLDDITTAIPKVAPVIKQMGGNVKDLAFFLTAMKEGGINASEGANALKSGIASIINPTKKATAMLSGFGIDIKKIVLEDKGNLKKTIIDFATALNQLDPLNRAQAIEQMFGKFQFARISTLFANVTKQGTQASRVLDLAGASVQDLANLSEKELGITSESAMNKFKKAVEDLKVTLVPVGEEFLKAVTPIANFVTGILDKFNNLGPGVKKTIVVLTTIIAGLGPVLLMTFGLLANGLANIIKGFTAVKTLFNKTGQSSATLGTEVKYMTLEQRNAAAVAASLDQVHKNLAQTFTAEAEAVNLLASAYARAISKQAQFMPGGQVISRTTPKKRAKGRAYTVGGTGNQDTELSLLTPGETVIPKDMSKKYGGLINGIIADNIPGYANGRKAAYWTQSKRNELLNALGLQPGERARIPLEATSSAYSVSGIMAPQSVNRRSNIGMTQEYLQSPLGRAAAMTNVQVGLEELGSSAARVSNVLNLVEPHIQDAITAWDGTTKSWQNISKAAMGSIESISQITADEKAMIRRRFAPINPDDYTVGSNTVTEVSRRRATTRNERVNAQAIYRSERQLQILREKGFNIGAGFDFAHMPGYEKIEANAVRVGSPTVAGRTLTPQQSAILQQEKQNFQVFRAEQEKLAEQNANATIKAVEKGAGTASPSKKTRKVGQDIARGLQLGMKDQQAATEAAAAKLADSATVAAQKAHVAQTNRMLAIGGVPTSKIRAAQQSFNNLSKAEQEAILARRMSGLSAKTPTVPTMPEGATQLPIIARPTQTLGQRAVSGVRGIAGRMGRLGGGMGLLGANMALGALPDFAGKGIIQSTMTGANMGMLFGPWGAAAGSAIGLVSGALTTLIAKEKEHEANVKSTFTSSKEIIKLFGDQVLDTSLKITNITTGSKNLKDSLGALSPEIQSLVTSIQQLPEDNPLSKFVKNIADPKVGLRTLTGSIRSQVTTAIATGGLDPKNAEKYVQAILAAANKTSDFGKVWKSVSKDVIDVQTATTASLNKLNAASDKTGSSWEYVTRAGQRFGKSYKSLTAIQKAFSDQMLNLFSVTSNGSLTFDQIKARIDGIKASSINSSVGVQALTAAINASGNKDAIDRLNQIKLSLQGMGGAAAVTAANIMMMNSVYQVSSASAVRDWATKKGLYDTRIPENFRKTDAQLALEYFKSPEFRKASKELADIVSPTTQPYKDSTATTNAATTASEQYLKILKAEIDALQAKRDAQKAANDEVQRNIDLQMKLQDLANQAVQAKISGNYLQAAAYGQQASNLQMQFNQETEQNKQDAVIAKLQARYDAIQGGAKLTTAETAKITKKASGGLITGPGTGTSDSIRASLGYAGGGSIRVSNGEYVVKASSVAGYGINTMNAINNGTANVSTNPGSTVYNINMPITSNATDTKAVGDYVIKQLKLVVDKNNKSNAVRY